MESSTHGLGQGMPAARELGDIYQSAAQGWVSCFNACNQGDTPARIRFSMAIDGEKDARHQYLIYDRVIPAHKEFYSDSEMPFAKGVKFRVYSDTGLVSFALFGRTKNLRVDLD